VALCGIDRIDDLLAGKPSALNILPGDDDKQSVGAVQELLTGHGQRRLPNLLSPNYGVFGSLTAAAVQSFRKLQNLGDSQVVDCSILQALVRVPAQSPIISRPYLTLVLDFAYSGLAKILSVVAQMEGGGRFAALNLNTDWCGLSFGLIQWAQKPGRLAEILSAFNNAERDDFVQVFGAGSVAVADGLLGHTRKPYGGVDRKAGTASDAGFDLVREPWVSRFRRAALWVPFQKVQVQTALVAFQHSCDGIRKFAPEVHSEQGIAFMIDVANQFGNGGVRSLYRAVRRDGMNETALLQAIATESVKRMQVSFKAATQIRRQSFLATIFVSDTPFANAATANEPA
jgi:hypothetical protein